ncbi:MAG: hypothetical protein HFJ47_01675 [Clostridia bacterium]|nr:hypothetical protein [Clostridia bacterium]
MKNKTNIEEDINIIKDYIHNWYDSSTDEDGYDRYIIDEDGKIFINSIENILTYIQRILEDKEILEDNYQILSESVSKIAKELGLQEDATIDEIYTAIKILKSKRLNMFEQLECNERAKKYDRLVEKIKQFIKDITDREDYDYVGKEWRESEIVDYLQEILDTEQEDKQ